MYPRGRGNIHLSQCHSMADREGTLRYCCCQHRHPVRAHRIGLRGSYVMALFHCLCSLPHKFSTPSCRLFLWDNFHNLESSSCRKNLQGSLCIDGSLCRKFIHLDIQRTSPMISRISGLLGRTDTLVMLCSGIDQDYSIHMI